MVNLIKPFSFNTYFLVCYIVLSSLFVSENVLSTDRWDRSFTKVCYNPTEYSISIQFIFFNYHFLSKNNRRKHAYLKWCNFYFTTDGQYYTTLMRVETKDQNEREITNLMMRNKLLFEDLQFLGCFQPADASRWAEDHKNKDVYVKNIISQKDGSTCAIFTVKWFPGQKYMSVKRIRLHGLWFVNGAGYDEIKDVDYDNLSVCSLKSAANQTENNPVKVTAKADAIVITGAKNGENIKVFNMAGVELQSSVTNSDVVNIKLPKNQTYIVNVGQARYKLAM